MQVNNEVSSHPDRHQLFQVAAGSRSQDDVWCYPRDTVEIFMSCPDSNTRELAPAFCTLFARSSRLFVAIVAWQTLSSGSRPK